MRSAAELIEDMWVLAVEVTNKTDEKRGQEMLAMITDLEKLVVKPGDATQPITSRP